jgi:hypothetical protein
MSYLYAIIMIALQIVGFVLLLAVMGVAALTGLYLLLAFASSRRR